MFFGLRLLSQILNFVFSFFPTVTLVYLAYKIWDRKRVPSGFFQLFFALILTFVASFQVFILVLFFEYLYDYEASIATIVFWIGLIFALWGINKVGENISQNLSEEINKIIKWVVFLSLVFLVFYYLPIYFKIQRTLIWKVGALFYGFSSVSLWGIFTSIALIAGMVPEMRSKANVLKILSFYFLIEPLIYLTFVAFEVLPSWLFTARMLMSAVSVVIALYVVFFTLLFTLRYLNQIISGVERVYSGRIKLVSLRRIKKFVLTSIPFIGILLFLQAFLIKKYIEFEVERYAREKEKLLRSVGNNIEFALNESFKILKDLSEDKDVIEINIPMLHLKYARVFPRFPDYIRNVSRVDENGILRYTYPVDPKAIGRDVSYQEHNKKFLMLKKPVVSSVFKAVQGYDAVVLEYPVFDSKGKFRGGVSCLIDVEKMLEHFTKMTGGGLDEFLIFSVNSGSVLFASNYNFVGGNFYDVLNKLVRSDVKSLVAGEINSSSSNGTVIVGRHKWLRKINFAFSFVRFELLDDNTEAWAIVNLIDEENLLKRYGYHLQVYYILLFASLLILGYLLFIYFNSVKYSFDLEEELDRQVRVVFDSERKYRELADNPFVGLAIYDENGFISVNRRLCEILGYELDELMKLTPFDFIHPEDRDKWVERAIKLLHGEYAPERTSYRAIKRDGSIAYLVCYSKLINHGGKPAVQTVIFDATKEKMQEDMLRHLQRVESIGTFTMGMAHDFNNILQIIIASAQMIDLKAKKRELKSEDLVKYIDNIISISNRGAELIKRLKIFARKEIPNAEIVDLGQIVLNSAEIMKSVFPKFIEIEVKIDSEGIKVYGSKTEIQQALLNICVNAKDAIIEKKEKGLLDGPGKITIEVSVKNISLEEAEIFKVSSGKYACISVVDNGIGMDEKTRERVFEPFFTTKKPEIGTGLGMSTVFGIVSSHGGFIRIDSKLGEGTKVEFCLPLVDEISQKVAVSVESVKKVDKKSAVMIVSEKNDLREKLIEAMRGAGFEVLCSEDKVIAVKMLSENLDKVDLILINSKTQRLKLKDTIAELKILKPDVKIVLLYSTPETEGIDGVEVLEKPEDQITRIFENLKNVK
ncbi:PAS domain S-box-containing protein [Candidatus Kryptobacter tengchongensis]|nr:PAS domain S-box-containing protein [Candidatus Kryptobacter tengchongensis]